MPGTSSTTHPSLSRAQPLPRLAGGERPRLSAAEHRGRRAFNSRSFATCSNGSAPYRGSRRPLDNAERRNPSAMVDIIHGAFREGMRDFTFNL